MWLTYTLVPNFGNLNGSEKREREGGTEREREAERGAGERRERGKKRGKGGEREDANG